MENYDNLYINSTSNDYLISYVRSKSLFSLILSKYSRLKVQYLSRKCLLFMLLMICRDMERLPGPEVMENFSNMRGIIIMHQNIRRLFTNFGLQKPGHNHFV